MLVRAMAAFLLLLASYGIEQQGKKWRSLLWQNKYILTLNIQSATMKTRDYTRINPINKLICMFTCLTQGHQRNRDLPSQHVRSVGNTLIPSKEGPSCWWWHLSLDHTCPSAWVNSAMLSWCWCPGTGRREELWDGWKLLAPASSNGPTTGHGRVPQPTFEKG